MDIRFIWVFFITIMILIISGFLYVKASGNLSLTKFNMISLSYYFFIVSSTKSAATEKPTLPPPKMATTPPTPCPCSNAPCAKTPTTSAGPTSAPSAATSTTPTPTSTPASTATANSPKSITYNFCPVLSKICYLFFM